MQINHKVQTMVENEKKQGFMDVVKEGLGTVSKIIVSSVVPPIAEGAETIMKNIDERLMRVEKRILRKICNILIIGFGSIFLIFALLFFMIEYLHWSNAVSFFAIGITILVIGLIMKLTESEK